MGNIIGGVIGAVAGGGKSGGKGGAGGGAMELVSKSSVLSPGVKPKIKRPNQASS